MWKMTPPFWLGLLFVGLKLTHVIEWSWWWVTCPFWIGAAIGLPLLLLAKVLEAIDRRRNPLGYALKDYADALRRKD
jgi:MFS family permease